MATNQLVDMPNQNIFHGTSPGLQVFSIDHLSETILEYVTLEDIKQCRFVCKSLATGAMTTLLRKSWVKFEILTQRLKGNEQESENATFNEKRNEEYVRRLKKLKKLNGTATTLHKIRNLKVKVGEHCIDKTKFLLSIGRLYQNTLVELDYTFPLFFSHKYKNLTTEKKKWYILEQISTVKFLVPRLRRLKKLRLTPLLEHDQPVYNFLPTMPTTVEQLTLLFGIEVCIDCTMLGVEDRHFQNIIELVGNFPFVFPKLKTLVLEKAYNLLPERFLMVILDDGIRPKLQNLRNLTVENMLSYNHPPFAQLDFPKPLNSLFVEIGHGWENVTDLVQMTSAYGALIARHAPTLTNLELRTWPISEPTGICLVLPIMPRLKCLQVAQSRSHSSDIVLVNNHQFIFLTDTNDEASEVLDYSKQFPVLEKLSFRLYENKMKAESPCKDLLVELSPILNNFLPREQTPPLRSTILRWLDIIGLNVADHIQYFRFFEKYFPNVHNLAFNTIRKLKN